MASSSAAGADGGGTCWPYFDPDYENLEKRHNTPRVVVDNQSHEFVTLIKVDSANIDGVLLDVVQILTDLELAVHKAYISSDGVWFMDVFHVTTDEGRKVADDKALTDIIQQKLEVKSFKRHGCARSRADDAGTGSRTGVPAHSAATVIELSGADRPGLLSEISAVLTAQDCNVAAAEVWTHNRRVACVVYATDKAHGGPVADAPKLALIKLQLSAVMRRGNGTGDREGECSGRTDFAVEASHSQRRLHQLLYAGRDYDFPPHVPVVPPGPGAATRGGGGPGARDEDLHVEVQVRNEKGYSVVNVTCKDRPKLLFDTVCTLTDMDYVVFHATIDSENGEAVQEYYIRRKNGQILDAEAEGKVIKCLKAAIQRRVSSGVRLELCTSDRPGLLSEITCIFVQNGLSVTKADVTTQNGQAVNVFYVVNSSGSPVDMSVVEGMRKQIGQTMLKVADEVVPRLVKSPPREAAKPKFSFGNLFKSHIFYNLGLIKPAYE